MLLTDMLKMKDLRKKLFFTLIVLVITRVGTVIPIPGIDSVMLREFVSSNTGNVGLVEFLNFFSGGAFSQFSLFSLGVMPYISMQIILQLLMLIIPKLKKWSEDADGQRKIQKLNRYGTIVVCLLQSFTVTVYARSIENNSAFDVITMNSMILFTFSSMIALTAGTMALVWFGEKITKYGVGNGISLLIFAGIVARIPNGISTLITIISAGQLSILALISIVLMFVIIVVLVVYEQEGERRIPVNYAKRVVGRKMYGSQSSYIPFKINPSGVIPVIFASAILQFILQIASLVNVKWLSNFADWLNPQGAPYCIISTILIIAFAFFYTQVSLNPTEMAKQIKDNGGAIPGVRAEQVELYLKRVLNRIVLPGALFLAFINLIPTLVQLIFKLPAQVAMLFGGTSLIILVGCDLEMMRQIESIMKMHHHPGFLGVKSIKSRRVKTRNL